MSRYCLLDCEDAEKWKGHEQYYTSVLDGAWDVFTCYTGSLPPLDTLRDYNAVFITGSHYSVYERRAWISQLKAYLRLAIHGRRVPVKFIGICFGCQVLADALGGKVGPNPDGTFVCKVEAVSIDQHALQRCGLTLSEPCLRLIQSHGDQVLQLPPDAVLLGHSPTAPHELWALEDRVLAIQGHPELRNDDVVHKILPAVRARMDDTQAAASSTSLQHDTPTPAAVWGLVRAFVHRAPDTAVNEPATATSLDTAADAPTTTAFASSTASASSNPAPTANTDPHRGSALPTTALFWKSLPTLLETSFFTTAPFPASGSLTTATDAAADAAHHTSRALAAEGDIATSQYRALTACNVAIARRFRSMEAYATGMAAFVDGVGQRLDSVERMHAAAQHVEEGLRKLEARVEALRVLSDALSGAAAAASVPKH